MVVREKTKIKTILELSGVNLMLSIYLHLRAMIVQSRAQ
jgi:hypothetical protein